MRCLPRYAGAAGGSERFGDPGVRRGSLQPLLGGVEAASEAIVVAVRRRRVDVAPVDAQRRRAEEALAACAVLGVDAVLLGPCLDTGLLEQAR